MKVTPTGEPLRYRVQSEHQKPDYFVDLSENEGLGLCDCPHFICVLQPKHKLTGIYGDIVRCKHIKSARAYAIEAIIKEFIHQESALGGSIRAAATAPPQEISENLEPIEGEDTGGLQEGGAEVEASESQPPVRGTADFQAEWDSYSVCW